MLTNGAWHGRNRIPYPYTTRFSLSSEEQEEAVGDDQGDGNEKEGKGNLDRTRNATKNLLQKGIHRICCGGVIVIIARIVIYVR
jgi:hypothetical protein